MIIFRTQWRRWEGETVVVTASGPSLVKEIIPSCFKIIAVNDSYHFFPQADVLYACDERWWEKNYQDVKASFKGERWSSHSSRKNHDDKMAASRRFDLWLVGAKEGSGFCLDGSTIHYGGNSGFQAINLALLFGAKRILLLGFDMKRSGKADDPKETRKTHFFGEHAAPLYNNPDFTTWCNIMSEASLLLPSDIEIINCSRETALTCFKRVALEELIDQESKVAA